MINRVVLMGRLTADPELKHTASDIPVTSFNIAVDRRNRDDGADFITIVAWRGAAEFICKYFSKGQMIAIDGRIQVRPWEDKNGNKRQSVEVVVDNVSFCGSKNSQSKQPEDQQEDQPEYDLPESDFQELTDDDLPF
ncbi:MAG: single-stranded DNA-binding protein [Lachnospiraceae bacterium]|jgi:single-strand DNA-binding protein